MAQIILTFLIPAARFGLALPQVMNHRGALFYQNNCAGIITQSDFANPWTLSLPMSQPLSTNQNKRQSFIPWLTPLSAATNNARKSPDMADLNQGITILSVIIKIPAVLSAGVIIPSGYFADTTSGDA